jgi:predicted metal-dependent hydrolase
MTVELELRRMDFRFPDDIPLYFNPRNMGASHFVNTLSMLAPAFERFFIRAIRENLAAISDDRIRRDADVFCRQEAQHARYHQEHLRMLIRKQPEIDEGRKQVAASYQELFERESTGFHLAYAATIELCFGPLALFIIENRDDLFRGGDARIASFVLWHFVEEFEHRNCAIDVYNDIFGSHLYRLRQVPRILGHMNEVARMAQRAFAAAAEDGVVVETGARAFATPPARRRLRLLYELLCTFLPYHRPDSLAEPAWVTTWLADQAEGKDMRNYYA